MACIYLTFDVEEWRIPEHNGLKHPLNANTEFSRKGTLRLLRLLSKHGIKATFFVTGYFAEREPLLIRKIVDEGHEIASHSYTDINHHELNNKEIRGHIQKATRIIQKITGKKPIGFRTPQFSINDSVLKELVAQGYAYDSSIHPAIIPRYKQKPKKIQNIKEIPLSIMPLLKLPISWIWMRNIGIWWTKLGVWLNLKLGSNVVLYFHPWEFVQLPEIKGASVYITRNCGEKFFRQLEKLIIAFKKHEFEMMKDLK
jgi:peptidoglycan/xylan/chitin deacetylase (PgdA/CDA1 family)